MWAFIVLHLLCFLCDNHEIMSQHFQLLECTVSYFNFKFALHNRLELVFQIHALLNEYFEEVAIDNKVIRGMEVVIDSEIAEDFGNLLTVHYTIHQLYYYYLNDY
jgi:tyrosine-protein phosphatase YwqE